MYHKRKKIQLCIRTRDSFQLIKIFRGQLYSQFIRVIDETKAPILIDLLIRPTVGTICVSSGEKVKRSGISSSASKDGRTQLSLLRLENANFVG